MMILWVVCILFNMGVALGAACLNDGVIPFIAKFAGFSAAYFTFSVVPILNVILALVNIGFLGWFFFSDESKSA